MHVSYIYDIIDATKISWPSINQNDCLHCWDYASGLTKAHKFVGVCRKKNIYDEYSKQYWEIWFALILSIYIFFAKMKMIKKNDTEQMSL